MFRRQRPSLGCEGGIAGPDAASQRRALELVEGWSELARERLRALVEQDHREPAGNPYRGNQTSVSFYEKFPVRTVVFDARLPRSRVVAWLAGVPGSVSFRVDHPLV